MFRAFVAPIILLWELRGGGGERIFTKLITNH